MNVLVDYFQVWAHVAYWLKKAWVFQAVSHVMRQLLWQQYIFYEL